MNKRSYKSLTKTSRAKPWSGGYGDIRLIVFTDEEMDLFKDKLKDLEEKGLIGIEDNEIWVHEDEAEKIADVLGIDYEKAYKTTDMKVRDEFIKGNYKKLVAEKESYTTLFEEPNEDIDDLVSIIESRYGTAIADQFNAIMNGKPLENQNPNALAYIGEFLVNRGEARGDEETKATGEEILNYLKDKHGYTGRSWEW